jgi:hypothetical protein
MPETMTSDGYTLALVLDTLGRVTDIEMILYMSHHPRWPRQVKSCVAVADSFTNKCGHCKRSINITEDCSPVW